MTQSIQNQGYALQELEKDACHLAGSRSVCDLFRILPDVGVKEWAMYWLCGENL